MPTSKALANFTKHEFFFTLRHYLAGSINMPLVWLKVRDCVRIVEPLRSRLQVAVLVPVVVHS